MGDLTSTIPRGALSRKPTIFPSLCGSLLLAMITTTPAVAQQAGSPAGPATHAPDAAPAGAATQTGTAASSPDGDRHASDLDKDPSMSDQELLKAMGPQRQALFREFLQWRNTHRAPPPQAGEPGGK